MLPFNNFPQLKAFGTVSTRGLAMGIERMHSAKYWRMRAEEFRTKADCCEFPQTRDTLRQVANNYEQLARNAEQIVTVTELDERTLMARRRRNTPTISAPS